MSSIYRLAAMTLSISALSAGMDLNTAHLSMGIWLIGGGIVGVLYSGATP